MGNSNGFIEPEAMEHIKAKVMGLKAAAIGGFAVTGTGTILFLRLLMLTGMHFRLPGLGAGGILVMFWVIAALGAMGYLSWMLWLKSAAFGNYVNNPTDGNLSEALTLQKRFWQMLTMTVIGTYLYFALVALIG